MNRSESTTLVSYLLAAFRPRNWGEESTLLYASEVTEFDLADAQMGANWLVRHVEFMPSVAELRSAIETAGRLRREQTPKLSEEATWTEDEIASAREAGARILAEWRARHPGSFAPTIEAVVAKRLPVEISIGFNPAEVEAKREAARKAAAQIEQAETA